MVDAMVALQYNGCTAMQWLHCEAMIARQWLTKLQRLIDTMVAVQWLIDDMVVLRWWMQWLHRDAMVD